MSAVPSDIVFDRSMPSPARIAQAILEGFNRHYRRFRYVAQQAK
jgi:isocitrate dehydrogenase kinase/phosphatase